MVILHVIAVHIVGSNNPLGIDPKGPQDTLPFHPYYTMKDSFGACVFLIFFAAFVFFAPNYMGHPDNYIPANPAVTPAHIVPEWYFLPFYAILRAVPDIWFIPAKLAGVLAMFGSLVLLALAPWLDRSPVRSCKFRPVYKWFLLLFVADLILLGFAGAKPAEGAWLAIGRVATLWYFIHFLIVMPLVGKLERPLPLPTSIRDAVLKHSPGGGGGAPAGAAAKPMDKA